MSAPIVPATQQAYLSTLPRAGLPDLSGQAEASGPPGQATNQAGQSRDQSLGQSLGQARPQLRSRRLTFTLGPLGITYATDQVLWSDAPDSPGTPGSSGATGPPGSASAETQPSEAQATARSFGQSLYEAWRRQAREETAPAYGPGAARQAQARAAPAEESAAAQASGQAADEQARATRHATPTATSWRVRRAVAAYVARSRDLCAQGGLLCARA